MIPINVPTVNCLSRPLSVLTALLIGWLIMGSGTADATTSLPDRGADLPGLSGYAVPLPGPEDLPQVQDSSKRRQRQMVAGSPGEDAELAHACAVERLQRPPALSGSRPPAHRTPIAGASVPVQPRLRLKLLLGQAP